MSCRNGSYRKVRNLRVRPVPEMEVCLVFTPDDPNLYTLNPTAWLIFELCDGRPFAEMEDAFCEAVALLTPRNKACAELAAGIARLESQGLIEAAHADAFARST